MRNHGKAMCLSRCAATAGPCITGACMSQLARARVHDGLKWHDELGNVLAHAMKKKTKRNACAITVWQGALQGFATLHGLSLELKRPPAALSRASFRAHMGGKRCPGFAGTSWRGDQPLETAQRQCARRVQGLSAHATNIFVAGRHLLLHPTRPD